MKTKATVMLLLAVISYGTVSAQQPAVMFSDAKGWHKIGETTVDFKREKDQVMVMGADRFAALKFKVADAPVDIHDMRIFYEGGDSTIVKVNTPVLAGAESKIIDIKGGERNIKKIEFDYKTLPNRKDEKAHVEIWGYKSNEDKDKH